MDDGGGGGGVWFEHQPPCWSRKEGKWERGWWVERVERGKRVILLKSTSGETGIRGILVNGVNILVLLANTHGLTNHSCKCESHLIQRGQSPIIYVSNINVRKFSFTFCTSFSTPTELTNSLIFHLKHGAEDILEFPRKIEPNKWV